MREKFAALLIVVTFFCVVFMAGYSTSERMSLPRRQMVECRVKRVVDGNDEPASIDRGQIPRPYTIVVYQQPYKTFIVPGKLGEEDSRVWLTPPE